MQRFPNLHSTLAAPNKPDIIPMNSQWLSGEGAGSWFYIEPAEEKYQITRYNPEGKIECSGLFRIKNQADFNIHEKFEFIHLSHCKTVNIKQHNFVITMERVG